MDQLTSEVELERVFSADELIVFKHSYVCPISSAAKRRVTAWVAENPAVEIIEVDVIGSRPLSMAIADRLGVIHESPQAILVRDGQAVWSASHGAVTGDALTEAVGQIA